MNLTRWNAKSLMPKLPRFMERFFGKRSAQLASGGNQANTLPSVNISDADKAFEVSVALPGLDRKDVRVTVQNDYLCIESDKKSENEEKGKSWVRREYSYSSFRRVFRMPQSADPTKVQANMRNGMLSVRVGKKEGQKEWVKTIAVS